MYITKMTFSIIKQIVHVAEGNIENFHPSKNHCEPRLTMIIFNITLSYMNFLYNVRFTTTWNHIHVYPTAFRLYIYTLTVWTRPNGTVDHGFHLNYHEPQSRNMSPNFRQCKMQINTVGHKKYETVVRDILYMLGSAHECLLKLL
jgi:hypothetical protein